MAQLNKDKLSLWTRLRLCWDMLTRGKYDPRDYKTVHEQEQWNICEQRRRDMEVASRPRTDCPESEFGDQ
jgi:hypothetical protein